MRRSGWCVPVVAADAGQELVKVCAGETPVEWPGGGVVVLFEGEDLLRELVEALEVVGVRSLRWMTEKQKARG
jgi:hypothetical protein